jgi:hypothetical protein
MSLELVVVAIVVLVVALVVLTIFSGVIPRFGSLTDFQNYCRITGKSSCETTGFAPIDWAQNVNVGGQAKNCQTTLKVFSDCCTKTPNGINTWGC